MIKASSKKVYTPLLSGESLVSPFSWRRLGCEAVLLLLLSLFLSCTDSNRFKLDGEFSGLRQVDLFIYSTDGGMDHLDTLHVVDGYFEWETPLADDATFNVVFPNMSEQTILASPGDHITMKGDGTQLKSTRITGSEDNEELTKFRLTHVNDAEADLRHALEQYIKEHPNSRVALQLQKQLTRLNAKVAGVVTGRKLPILEFPDDHISPYDSTDLPHHPMLILFWAGWCSGSHEANKHVKDYLREHGDDTQLSAVSISLDSDKNVYSLYCRQDSIRWTTRCYLQVWDTPQAYALAIRQLPYTILTDSTGKVIAHGSNWRNDIAPHLK